MIKLSWFSHNWYFILFSKITCILYVLILNLIFIDLLHFKRKIKSWAFFVFWIKTDETIEFFNYERANNQTQTYSICIYFPFFVLNWTKKLKYLILILYFDSKSIISHRYFKLQNWVTYFLYFYFYFAIHICKLNRIRNQI